MTLLITMRRHSLRLQHQLHRWSICTDANHLLGSSLAPGTHMPRSRSCTSSAGVPCRESWSSASSDSVVSTESGSSLYNVVLIGGNGVGKSALASIFAGAEDSMDSDCELYGGQICEQTIVVDGEIATITLLDTWDCQEQGSWSQEQCMQAGDAYLIVYSITDRDSFEKASELRIQLRRARQSEDIPIILVGNKCDLVRCREVSVSEGRACAVVFDCKFIETSAVMQHNVQEMFEGIVRQLRLRRDSKEANERRRGLSRRRESLPKKAKRFLDKLVARNNKNVAFRLKSKSCHDLSVL
ncbi:GTP-binding protein GEM [Paramormyrops kingsleyae]|uniref:GTP-binding protein n=1 Tax=Paramormyrops kingsleyae TaxID=1676925 RepID=A0A3B3T1I5_9TELE|nr:GTP-binding protein GEM [Paramormyrops kingsleyae]